MVPTVLATTAHARFRMWTLFRPFQHARRPQIPGHFQRRQSSYCHPGSHSRTLLQALTWYKLRIAVAKLLLRPRIVAPVLCALPQMTWAQRELIITSQQCDIPCFILRGPLYRGRRGREGRAVCKPSASRSALQISSPWGALCRRGLGGGVEIAADKHWGAWTSTRMTARPRMGTPRAGPAQPARLPRWADFLPVNAASAMVVMQRWIRGWACAVVIGEMRSGRADLRKVSL
jgi:hypothetical protein